MTMGPSSIQRPAASAGRRPIPLEKMETAAVDLLGKLAGRHAPKQPLFPVAEPKSAIVSDSIRSASIAGWTVIILFFGVFGGWAMTAPLHGAVVANAVVKVEGNR